MQSESTRAGLSHYMARVLTDEEIDSLVGEGKVLPDHWQSRLAARPKSHYSYNQRELSIRSEEGNDFRIIIRRNRSDQLDFSIILTFQDSDGTEYRLVRYNGRH